MFTSFWRTAERELSQLPPTTQAPRRLGTAARGLDAVAIRDPDLLPQVAGTMA